MHTTKEDLPILPEDGPACIRATDWGGQRMLRVSLPAGMDITPLLRGLPDDLCQCPHWGYILEGRMRVIYTDGEEEALEAGSMWYLPPGHTVIVDEDVEFVEFSPPSEYDETLEVLRQNAAKVGQNRRRAIRSGEDAMLCISAVPPERKHEGKNGTRP